MKILLAFRLCLLAALLLTATAAAASITIAAYNVENYTLANRMVDGVYRTSYPKPEKERVALNLVVAGIAPDILAVEEMGTQPFLDDFQRELKQAGQDYPHTVLLEAADADRHVAVLSKVPFKEVRRHADVPTTYFGQRDRVKRGVLEVIFAASGGDFSLFVVHLKSKYTERPDDPESGEQRRLEAEAVRDLVLAHYPDPARGRFIVCGDWNDTRASKAVRTLLKRGETGLGDLLPAVDAHGESWTHYYRREDVYSRIDYFLVSPALLPAVMDHRARIWDAPGVADASDHRPLVVRLDLDPLK
ncbi:MAG TPA: endonuclease/exonuclease/phosphatase family protein [Lacunisphaera sp.]|nr:endonuclease/exonuclease/phosphatase family protein [Lacunisphaera sp.]